MNKWTLHTCKVSICIKSCYSTKYDCIIWSFQRKYGHCIYSLLGSEEKTSTALNYKNYTSTCRKPQFF